MSIKIKIKLTASDDERTVFATPEVLGFTDKEWAKIGYDEQHKAMVEYIDNLEQPCWLIVDSEETKGN